MNGVQISGTGGRGKSMRPYVIGFSLSILLTGLAFWPVMSGTVSRPVVLPGIIIMAVIQILVHLHYFLHLDSSSTARWNVLALLLTLLIMFLFVGGSIWIMYNLNYRMM